MPIFTYPKVSKVFVLCIVVDALSLDIMQNSIIWVYPFICYSNKEHLGCFQLGVIMNEVAINICGHEFG